MSAATQDVQSPVMPDAALIGSSAWFGHSGAVESDVVLTPDPIAKAVIDRFKPSGRILDPCRGTGAFWKQMPGADWCEIREGRDFYNWREPVDWIVSNPPYSVFADFLRHSFTVAENIVYLIPVNKAFNSQRMMREIWAWGGVETCLVVGTGAQLFCPPRKGGGALGYCIGAMHFRKNYQGPMSVEFHCPNDQGMP